MAGNHNTIRCPHCGGKVRTLTSRQLSPLVREIYFDCIDVIDCGHRFVAQLGIVRTIVPSLRPAPGVSLPITERRPNDIVVDRTAASATGSHPITSKGVAPRPSATAIN